MKSLYSLMSTTSVVAILVISAYAAPVTKDEAAAAAGEWASDGKVLGTKLGTGVASASEYAVPDAGRFYAVKLTGGGTVFMTADTELDPVIAFTGSSAPDLSEGSPMRRLLEMDVRLREEIRRKQRFIALTNGTGGVSSATSAVLPAGVSKRAWTAMIISAAATASAKPRSSLGPSELRVEPLLKTRWSQTGANEGDLDCYNYYTPVSENNGTRYPCGCTATAASQIMRRFEYPAELAEPMSFDCTVEGAVTNVTMLAGTYDWANMVYEPRTTEDDLAREAIGHLCFDVAVALKTDWTDAGGGSASPTDLAKVYRDVFGYQDAWVLWSDSKFQSRQYLLHDVKARQKMIFANLDAGRPVQLAIYGYPKSHVGDNNYWAGHSVVGDGYGFRMIDGEETEFVHINMGWSGSDDMWYNIPEIDAANSGAHVGDSGYDFCYMAGGAFNIRTDSTGLEILSGRITDYDGVPVENAVVTVYEDGSEVATAASSKYGVYFFELPGGKTYEVTAVSADGEMIPEAPISVTLGVTAGDKDYIVESANSIGNRWGNDLVIFEKACRLMRADTEIGIYPNLTSAGEFAEEGDVIELVRPSLLTKDFTVPVSLTVTSAVDMAVAPIRVGSGARIIVTNGISLAIAGIQFAGATTNVVEVKTGGQLHLSGDVDFGRRLPDVAVIAEANDGFVVDGELSSTNKFALSCGASMAAGGQFGNWAYAIGQAGAQESAKLIVCADDPELGLGGDADGYGKLVWKAVQCEGPEDQLTAGWYVDADGDTNCYSTVRRALAEAQAEIDAGTMPEDAVIILKRGGVLESKFTPAASMTLRGESDEAVPVEVSARDGFLVTNGVLTVENLLFRDFTGNALFTVNGCGLVFEAGTVVSNAVIDVKNGAAVVNVLHGDFTMMPGSAILDCLGRNYGGAVLLNGEDCVFDMQGGVISGCSALVSGGGVYVYAGSLMKVQGQATVDDNYVRNSNGSKKSTDNVYLAGENATLELDDILGGKVGVKGQYHGNESNVVAVVSTTPENARESKVNFVNDQTEGLIAEFVEDENVLIWVKPAVLPLELPEGDPSAVALLYYDEGPTNYYGSVHDAFVSVTNDGAVVELIADASFASELFVTNSLTLKGREASGANELKRAADCSIVVPEGVVLTITNLTVNGNVDIVCREPIVYARQGTLILQKDALVTGQTGYGTRASTGVVVWCGRFEMESGAAIFDCWNMTDTPEALDEGSGCGGGLLVDNSVAVLRGGSITDCKSYRGGVAITSFGQLYVGGDTTIKDNLDLGDDPFDMIVHNESMIHLTDDFTGWIGWNDGIGYADPRVFGVVEDTFPDDSDKLMSSAANFFNEATTDTGVAVTNDSSTILLVWKKDLAEDGSFTNSDDVVYFAALPDVVPVFPDAIGFRSIVRDDGAGTVTATLTNLVTGCWYSFFVTNTLSGGFVTEGAEPKEKMQATADGDYDFVYPIPAAEEKLFIRAIGEPGLVTP